jgi:general secretion pathway protein D
VAAQDKEENNEKLVQIKFDKGTEITEILDHIRKSTRRPLLYDASDTRIRSRKLATDFSTKVPADKLFSVFRAMLAFFELTLVPIGPQGYEIYLVISSRSTNNLVKNKAEYVDYKDIDKFRDQDGLYISCAIPIRHIENLQLLRTALSTMISPAGIGRVHEVTSSQSLIIMDFAPTVWAMVQLIKQMDVEPPGRKMVMEFIELKFAFADEVADIVSELVSAQRQAVTQPRPGQAFRASQTPEPRILAYEPRNALVIAATEDDFKLIKSLIDRFDLQEGEGSSVEVVRLKHVEAEDIADTLSTVMEGLQGQLPGTTGRPQPGRARGPGTTRTGGRTRQVEPQVVPDPGTNALIITGDRKTIQALKDIIKEMDQPKDQVLIEAAIISVQRTDEFELGVEIVAVDDTGLNSDTASGFGFTNFGLSTFEDTDGDLIPDINIPNALITPGGGLVAGIFRNGNIPIFLNAIQRLQNAKIVSMPSVITYDNEEATLEALSQEPTGVTTDLASGGVQSGFDDFASAGVILHVSPHISADNYLRLNIEIEVSSFTGEPPAAGFPSPRQQNILTTTIALPNEHTVVMGGLISEEEAVQEAKIPILGDLPIIGYLFKNRSRRRIKRNLFMFVTPHILRQHENSFDDLHRQSWIAKQKADKLIEHVEIHNSRFREDPRYKDELAEEEGEAKLDIGSLLNAGIFVDVTGQDTIREIERLRAEAKAKK